MEVDLAIPVLNEELVLASSVARILDYCRAEGFDNLSITIADNGSSDATPSIARELARTLPQVRCIRVDRPALGAALQEAWRSSSAAIVGYMDVDLTSDLGHLGKAIRFVAEGSCEMVLASRQVPGAAVKDGSLLRLLISRSYNEILRRRLKFRGSDAACGFKLLTRGCYERIAEGAELSEGLFFGSELAVRGFALGASIREVPLDCTHRRDSRIRVLPSAIAYWREMGRLKRELACLSPASMPRSEPGPRK